MLLKKYVFASDIELFIENVFPQPYIIFIVLIKSDQISEKWKKSHKIKLC